MNRDDIVVANRPAPARGAGVSVDDLIDDNLELPEELLGAARAQRAAERRKKIRKKQGG